MQLGFTAEQEVLGVIGAMGPTEDIRFFPDRRRFAVAASDRDLIYVFDIEIRMTPAGKQIHLSAVVELSSSQLKYPHGLDFIDNETLVVANRGGDLALFRIPPGNGSTKGELILLQTIASNDMKLSSPGSVVVSQIGPGHHEVLASRTFAHQVSRDVVATSADYAVTERQVLLAKWLETPDGISIDPRQRWLAVSNHNTHSVLIYSKVREQHVEIDPVAVLRGSDYPHGLRFSDDGRYILVTDAGAPYVYIYFQDDGHWQGVYDPSLSLRVMNDPVFQSGNTNPEEGGPKGLDLDCTTGLLVTTCPNQPLAFFDLNRILANVYRSGPLDVLDGTASVSEGAGDVRHELEKQQRHAQAVTSARQAAHAEQRATLAEQRANHAEQYAAQTEQRATHAERYAVQTEQRATHAERYAAQTEQRATHAEQYAAETEQRAAGAESRVQAILCSNSWRVTAPLRWAFAARKPRVRKNGRSHTQS
ncbi:hypothetical protein [Pseudomonas sp. C2B4]|uniref:hypothetical protein n=1 Tax=Pseudomonas sp. C2B4 TaxID=2735270 RepID=UPI001586936C|nr:hypothetical protein [Pseudomonas sp. C2B4]